MYHFKLKLENVVIQEGRMTTSEVTHLAISKLQGKLYSKECSV